MADHRGAIKTLLASGGHTVEQSFLIGREVTFMHQDYAGVRNGVIAAIAFANNSRPPTVGQDWVVHDVRWYLLVVMPLPEPQQGSKIVALDSTQVTLV